MKEKADPTPEMIEAGLRLVLMDKLGARVTLYRGQVAAIYLAMKAVEPDRRRVTVGDERNRCVGVLVRKARETAKTGRAFKGDVGSHFLAISAATMIYARELYGPRKGADHE
jgi:hypothetical protein